MLIPPSYPVHFIKSIQLKDGTSIRLRPIHPIDGDHAEEFREKLSAESIYNRFLGYIPKISDKLVDRLTNIDYTREMAIVAEVPVGAEDEVIAVGRIAGDFKEGADFGIIISDEWQGKGLGTILTQYLVEIAGKMKFPLIKANLFATNQPMIRILRKLDFEIENDDYQTKLATLKLE